MAIALAAPYLSTMAETTETEDCARLRRAIQKGVLSVKIGDKQVTYQSTAQMIAAYQATCGPLTPLDGGGSGPGRGCMVTQARFNRGPR